MHPTSMRLLAALLACVAGLAAADDLPQQKIDDIIKTFAAKEAEFSKARAAYTYRQTARIQDIDRAGTTVGRWEEVADILFDANSKRTEKVVRAPVSTLKNFSLSPEDLQDLRDIQPFVLTTDTVANYYVRYLGKEKLDDLDCYAFAVKPKQLVKGQRYFSGIVWVDDQDIQVVRTYGRGVGITAKNQAFPKFETTRQKIDGQYWFPVYTIAEDTLFFEDTSARIRQVVRYEDYKRFAAESRIIGAEEVPAEPPKPAPAKQ